MNKEIFFPDRYENKKYKLINRYFIFKDHVELRVEERYRRKLLLKVLLDKETFDDVSQYHWSTSLPGKIPCARVDKKTFTIGQFVGDRQHRNFGKLKNKNIFDFRKEQRTKTGNIYSKIDKRTIELKIVRKNFEVYTVLFDKEDHKIIRPYYWRAERDGSDVLSVIANIKGRTVFMHRHIITAHGEKPRHRLFRDIRPENNQFDFRKSTIYQKYLTNYYKIIDFDTFELVINSIHGVVRVLIDSEDYQRISKVTWVYKRHGEVWSISSSKFGVLKRFILSDIRKDMVVYIKEKKDRSGRLDFRKHILREGLTIQYTRNR